MADRCESQNKDGYQCERRIHRHGRHSADVWSPSSRCWKHLTWIKSYVTGENNDVS